MYVTVSFLLSIWLCVCLFTSHRHKLRFFRTWKSMSAPVLCIPVVWLALPAVKEKHGCSKEHSPNLVFFLLFFLVFDLLFVWRIITFITYFKCLHSYIIHYVFLNRIRFSVPACNEVMDTHTEREIVSCLQCSFHVCLGFQTHCPVDVQVMSSSPCMTSELPKSLNSLSCNLMSWWCCGAQSTLHRTDKMHKNETSHEEQMTCQNRYSWNLKREVKTHKKSLWIY